MHYGRIHRGNREHWISELTGEDRDDLEPSVIDPGGRRRRSNRRATNLGTSQDFADRLLGDDHDCDDDGCSEWTELSDGAKPIRPTGRVHKDQLVRLTVDGHCIPLAQGVHGLAQGETMYVARTDIEAGSTGWVEPARRP
jgi:hypothetical protein